MSSIGFDSVARELPAWKSTIVGRVGPARVKVLRMDEMAYEEETHEYNEGLLVVTGRLMPEVAGEAMSWRPDRCISPKREFLTRCGRVATARW